MARLRRIKDGKGDEGSRVEAIKWSEEGKYLKLMGNEPIIGCSLLVGSVTARSYSDKDYWLTTEVTKIIEKVDSGNQLYVKFKTGNSTYEFWS